MQVVRDAFRAQYGRGEELVAVFKGIAGHWEQSHHPISLRGHRIMTDASGSFCRPLQIAGLPTVPDRVADDAGERTSGVPPAVTSC